MSTLTSTRYESLPDFLHVAGDWLAAREAEHNLMLGIVGSIVESPASFGDEPPYLVVVAPPDGGPVAVVLRTPPWGLVLSEVDDPTALDLVAERVVHDQPDVLSVVGPAEHVAVLAPDLAARLGLVATRTLSERAFVLRSVIPPRPATGLARIADHTDRDLVLAWFDAFDREAFDRPRPAAGSEARIDRALAREGSRQLWLWDDDGPVSMTGIAGPTPTGIRVGPVYTPPEHRGRGYASNLVAAASQAALDGGRRALFLFTDLANPTSNRIYQAIGYEPVRDVDEWSLDPPSSGEAASGGDAS